MKARWVGCLGLLAVALAACDSGEATLDDPLDVTGAWSGEMMTRVDAVLGGNRVTLFDIYELDLDLDDQGPNVTGSGRLRHACSGRTATSCSEPLYVQGDWIGLTAAGTRPLGTDSTLSLALSVAQQGLPFANVTLALRITPDGRTLSGPVLGVGGSGEATLTR